MTLNDQCVSRPSNRWNGSVSHELGFKDAVKGLLQWQATVVLLKGEAAYRAIAARAHRPKSDPLVVREAGVVDSKYLRIITREPTHQEVTIDLRILGRIPQLLKRCPAELIESGCTEFLKAHVQRCKDAFFNESPSVGFERASKLPRHIDARCGY
jgi:hypothetical protein